ncbi:MAG: murein biosynthesis integral membrane protein MurJ, partial [Desulfobacteraceae bacterium]|nr:murein biosynthesis integral membrane protein MurJ [Desulfobacteraceae bacterium]
MGFLNRRQQMGWAALIIGTSVFLSRFMGLVRDKVISYLFGATNESDIYFAAFVIPDFINYLLAGGYFSITLIPFLADLMNRDRDEGWRFFSVVFTWISIAIVTLTCIAMWFAPELARIAAPGLNPEAMERLTRFLRIILPAQVFFLTGSCFTAVLYLRKQFLAPALTPLIYNLSIILGGILLKSKGMEGFCWGVLAGALVGNLLVPLLAVRQGEGMRLYPALRHPGLKRYILLALPLMLGQSIAMLDEQMLRVFGSLAGIGAVSWLAYARRIMMVPVSVVGQAAGVASYPFIAELAAKKEFARFHEVMNNALRNVLTLLVPLSVWMAIVSEPTVRLIFQQGHFTLADTAQTATLLRILLPAVCFWGFQQVLGRAFYARQDTLSPAVLGTVTTLCAVPIFLFLTRHLQAQGVA